MEPNKPQSLWLVGAVALAPVVVSWMLAEVKFASDVLPAFSGWLGQQVGVDLWLIVGFSMYALLVTVALAWSRRHETNVVATAKPQSFEPDVLQDLVIGIMRFVDQPIPKGIVVRGATDRAKELAFDVGSRDIEVAFESLEHANWIEVAGRYSGSYTYQLCARAVVYARAQSMPIGDREAIAATVIGRRT